MRSRATAAAAVRAVLVAVAVIAAVSAGACAIIPEDGEPRAIPREDLPEELLAPSTTTTTAPVEPEYELPLYFLNSEDQLVMTTRDFDSPPSVQDTLDALAASPTAEEFTEHGDISSKLFAGLQPQALPVESGVLQVQVAGEEMSDAADAEARRVTQIYSQIVCSVGALGVGVERVQIQDAKGPVKVQIQSSGEIVEEAVGPSQFNDCKTAEQLAEEAAAAEEGEDGSTTTGSTPTTIAINGSG